MIKVIAISIFLVFGAFCLSVIYGNELICDLNKGTLGDLQIGYFKRPTDIAEAMGGKPDVIGFGTHSYFAQGIDIILVDDKGKSMLHGVVIYYLDYVSIANEYYKRFKGKFNPTLNSKEIMNTIKEKFGLPDQIRRDAWGMTRFDYKRPYGELSFCFEEGGLHIIEMYQGDIHTDYSK